MMVLETCQGGDRYHPPPPALFQTRNRIREIMCPRGSRIWCLHGGHCHPAWVGSRMKGAGWEDESQPPQGGSGLPCCAAFAHAVLTPSAEPHLNATLLTKNFRIFAGQTDDVIPRAVAASGTSLSPWLSFWLCRIPSLFDPKLLGDTGSVCHACSSSP